MSTRSQYIEAATLKRLSKLKPHRTLLWMILDWAVIAAGVSDTAVSAVSTRMNGAGWWVMGAPVRYSSGVEMLFYAR